MSRVGCRLDKWRSSQSLSRRSLRGFSGCWRRCCEPCSSDAPSTSTSSSPTFWRLSWIVGPWLRYSLDASAMKARLRCLSVSLCVSVPPLSLSPSVLSHPLAMSIYLSLSVSLCLSLSLSIFLSVSYRSENLLKIVQGPGPATEKEVITLHSKISISPATSSPLCLCLRLSLSIYLSVYFYVSLPFVSHSVSLCTPCISVCHCLCLSVSLSACLSVSPFLRVARQTGYDCLKYERLTTDSYTKTEWAVKVIFHTFWASMTVIQFFEDEYVNHRPKTLTA